MLVGCVEGGELGDGRVEVGMMDLRMVCLGGSLCRRTGLSLECHLRELRGGLLMML